MFVQCSSGTDLVYVCFLTSTKVSVYMVLVVYAFVFLKKRTNGANVWLTKANGVIFSVSLRDNGEKICTVSPHC